MEKLPQWVLDLKRKNTEVKRVGDCYYLYEVHCHYDKETKKRYKDVKYIGILVEGVGVVPKGGKDEAFKKSMASSASADKTIEELKAQLEESRRREMELRSELEALRKRLGE